MGLLTNLVLSTVVAVNPLPPEPVSPVPVIDDYEVAFTNGVITKDGVPRFWAGNGCDLGSGQATPAGLWLAKLQGVTMTTHEPGSKFALRDDGTNTEIRAGIRAGAQSWVREAIRLGMLTEMPIGGGQYFRSPLKEYSDAHPDFHEVCYQAGHGIQFDTSHPLGLRLLTNYRILPLDYLKGEPHFILELNREPGQNPTNARAREGFRQWAKEKYADLAEANATWGTAFASWDAVELPHMSADPSQAKRWAVLRRNETKEKWPNLYWDWMLYLQKYTRETLVGEMAPLRRRYPDMPMTIDVRGHRNNTDCYCAYDPTDVDKLVDLFFIHYHYTAYHYGQTPWDLKTLLDQTCFPLFCVNYLRTNTRKPLVDCEDIVSKAAVPFSSNDAMVRNDIAGLHKSSWKFRIEGAGEDGLASNWFSPDFDDSSWGGVAVPGAWDEQPDYRDRQGVGWYRKRFFCDVNVMDYLDGSRKFFIWGKGVAQSGTVWLNGEKVGEVKGWNTPYKFDVGHLLKFGGENEIVWRVDGGGRENGLRFFCHVLAHDMINETLPFGEKQFKSMFWTYLMGGVSGELVWNWMDDAIRIYYPRVLAPIEAAAPVVLPDVRHRSGKVAYLYAYTGSLALPSTADGEYAPWMNWYDALEFSGVRPDVVGEQVFVETATPEKYPLLVVPHAKIVHDETWQAFKRYILAGGRAFVTEDSFAKTFSRYRPTDLPAFAKEHSDRVTVVASDLEMESIMELLTAELPKPDVEIGGGDARERPMIERALAGDADRRVLYLHNWGGIDQPVTATIPAEYADWDTVPLEGSFSRIAGNVFEVVVPSQTPVALGLVRLGREFPPVPSSEKAEKALEDVASLQQPLPNATRKALFPARTSNCVETGKLLFPNWLKELRERGVGVESKPLAEWTPDMLKEYALVVVPEANSWEFTQFKAVTNVWPLLRDYVNNGGSLASIAWSAHTVNANAVSQKAICGLFGMGAGWTTACDPVHAGYGDPFQILTDSVESHPITKDVRTVQLFAVDPLSIKHGSAMKPLVRIPPAAKAGKDGVVMAAGAVGKGKVFISSEIMAFQPYRIEAADNAKLMSNIVDWLLEE